MASAALLALACLAFGLAPFTSHAAGARAASRTLTFEERVAHQRAVEEVYWRRTIWPSENKAPKPALDEVMPVEATRARVEDTLRKSQALARQWGREVTAEQLQAEMARMARETRQPEVLRELWRALGDDPFVIAEVLARPALVERLARTSFEAERKAARPEAAKASAAVASFDAWWEGAGQQFTADAAADESFAYQLAEVGGAAADDTWSPTQALPVSTGSAAVWTGAEVIIWGGTGQYGGRTNSGSRYNPATDTWTSISTVGAPSPRSGHAAHWTGTEFLVWGGVVGVNCGGTGPCRNITTSTGGRYNPLTDTWTPTSVNGAPPTSGTRLWTGSKLLVMGGLYIYYYDPSSDIWTATPSASSTGSVGNRAIWTGKEIFTWGGVDNEKGTRGAIYNPATNTWRQPNTFNAPSERNDFSMVWTGTEVIVWGGFEGNNVTLNTGGRYNPATDTWTPTSMTNAPDPRDGHVAVWTGSEMVVHGGNLRTLGEMAPTNTGARYNPANDTWTPVSTNGSPAKTAHVAVWTGAEVFVWGGSTGTGSFMKEGARFNPSNNTWTPVNNGDSPLHLDRGVWTGTEMIVWGHNSLCNGCSSTGGRFDPATNVWRPMNLAGAPTANPNSYGTNVLWTGKEMIVWGSGWGGGRGRYNPQTDTWAPISSTGAPAEGFSAVWSGKEMIVWGGSQQGQTDVGGRYNPETDSWRPTSKVGVPAGSQQHTAVWSGSEMIVWGGVQTGVGGRQNTGGRYNPETDTWRPTSTAGAPEARTNHTAVWTGSEMIVWGGTNDAVPASDSRIKTGGRYDPAADTWTPTTTAGAPQARADHRAVWTGSQMIVWGGLVKGGAGAEGTYTGARYNPSTDVWTATSTLSAPSKRSLHVQVWTGSQMIVWGAGSGGAAEGAATHGAVYNAPGALRAGNLAPAVSLTAPAGGASYQSGETVQLAAQVSDPDGSVTTVRFYADGQLVGSDTQAPYAFAWTDVRGGNYTLMAVATDDGNAEGRSAEANISVAPSTAPPACVLTAPADGSSFAYGASVRMEAAMTPNRDRAIARVEFLVDGQMVTYYEPPTYNPPYSHLYTANAAGSRSLAARCTDNLGGVTTSAPKVINVEEQGFSVSGQLLESANVPIHNVRVRLDGPAGTAPQYMTTNVGGTGNYAFGGLKSGQTYTITPEAGAWRWSPPSATYTAISRSYTQAHFYGTRVGVAITGKLTDAAGAPIYPATVYLSGSKNAYANVGADGTYFFYGLAPGGNYTVQPYKNLHTFAPGHRTFENLSADQAADFTGTMQGKTFTVSGRIVDERGAATAGMRVRLSLSQNVTRDTTTGADGRYSFAGVPYGDSIGVYPSDPTNTYRFTPVSQFKKPVTEDYVVPNFVAVPITYMIWGTVRDGSGQVMPGVTVNLSGAAPGSATTDANGSYTFRDLPGGGDYAVRPSKGGYTFTPQAATFTALRSNQLADFTGAQNSPPSVALTSPPDGASFAAPAAVVLTADASDTDGSVSRVDFYEGTRLVGTDAQSPYSVNWQIQTAGGYSVTAVAVDNLGATTTSRPVNVNATTAPTPAPTNGLTNFALAANGGVATASSTTTQQELPGLDFSPAGVINGDRRGLNWERGGGWRDGTNNSFPDWVQVDFNGPKAISEVGVFSLQDNYASPSEPTEAAGFTQYGLTAFDLLYWDGSAWAAVPGAVVVGNDRVWRRLSFPAVTTTRLRLVVRNALAGRSRLVEFEAWGAAASTTPPPAGARINAALASNGGVATASSTTTQQELPGMDFSPAGVINGDRRGLNWEHGGGWRDATNNAFPDWLEVSFAAPTAVDEVGVFSLQDNYASPSEPTEAAGFTKYGVTSFVVQYWDGAQWQAAPGGAVTNNGSVWRRVTFPAVTTTRVRVVVNSALAGRSRLVEVEAWGVQSAQPQPAADRVNHAAAANGGTASASSTTPDSEYPGLTFPASSVVDGDRRGLNWERGGGWRDGTASAYPDWVEVEFPAARRVDEVNVFSLQDNYTSPSEPTAGMAFTKYGVSSFEVQYWDGARWVTVPGGAVTGNSLVWRRLSFPEVTTSRIRVLIHDAMGGRSRLVEVEAVGPAP